MKGVVYDSSGSQLAATSAVSEATFSGGNLGYYVGGSPGYPVYIDYVTKTSLSSSGGDSSDAFTDSSQKIVADSFNTENFDPYDIERGASGASFVRPNDYSGSNPFGCVYQGTSSLKFSGENTEMISRPGDSLPDLEAYPSAGDSFTCYFMATDGADKLNITYGVQNHTDRYYVHIDLKNDKVMSMKYKGGSSHVLDSIESGFTLSEDTWYYITVHWTTDGKHDVYLYDLNENTIAEVEGLDSEWTSGGIGFDAYNGDGGTVYFDEFYIGEASEGKGGWGTRSRRDESTQEGDQYTKVFDTYFFIDDHDVYDVPYQLDDGTEITVYQHRLVIGGMYHGYLLDNDFERDPLPGKVHSNPVMGDNHFEASVTSGTDSNLTQNGYNYFDYSGNNTYSMALTGTEYDNWVENEWDSKLTRENQKQTAIENGSTENDWPSWFDIGLGVGSAVSLLWKSLGYYVVPIAIGKLITEIADEQGADCGFVTNGSATTQSLKWDFCDEKPVNGHAVQLLVNVPAGDQIEVEFEHWVNDPSESFDAKNACRWNLTFEGDSSTLEAPNSTLYEK